MKRFFVFLLCMTTLYAWAADTHIEGVRVWASDEKIRLVFDLSGKQSYHSFTLSNPDRVVIDLKKTKVPKNLSMPSINGTDVKGIRFGQKGQEDCRIVVDLKKTLKPNLFLLNPASPYGHRLVLDLKRNNVLGAPVYSLQSTPSSVKPALSVNTMLPRDFIIAIDPGHGGEDPGAIGHRYKTHEKDVVLKVAKHLVELINQQPGMQAFLTRKGDYYVGLRKRMQIARDHNADLFISIHADSFKDASANGASVFVLSEHGASSEAARWLAEKENRSDLIGGISLDDKNDVLASVLLDLSQTANRTASEDFASTILDSIKQVTSLHNRKVQRAGFMVLKSPDVPSILVELGFISNPQGERMLRKASHERALAKSIFKGIHQYLRDKPQPLVAMNSHWFKNKTHKVKRGESLSVLAKRYGVSSKRIKEANRLKSETLLIGQKLTIPIQESS